MTRRGVGGAIALLAVLATLSGCRTVGGSDLLSTTGTPLARDDARADRVLRDYLDSIPLRPGLRGSARVSLRGPDFKLNRPQRVVLERPARLRFEILGLFDQLAAILVSDGREFGFFDASTGEIERGRVTPDLLWQLAKIDLSPEEAVGLLLGAPEPESGLARAAVWLEADGRLALAFAWPADGGEPACQLDPAESLFVPGCFVEADALEEGGEVYFFDAEGRLVEFRALEANAVSRFRVRFEQFEALDGANGVIFPKRVTIESAALDSEARFDWKRVMLSGELSDRLFSLPEPGRRDRGQDGR